MCKQRFRNKKLLEAGFEHGSLQKKQIVVSHVCKLNKGLAEGPKPFCDLEHQTFLTRSLIPSRPELSRCFKKLIDLSLTVTSVLIE